MKLGVMTLAIMNVAAVVSLRGLPAEAVYGLSSAFYYLFAAIVFLVPTALVAAELAAMFAQKEGGVFRWVGEAYGKRFVWLSLILGILGGVLILISAPIANANLALTGPAKNYLSFMFFVMSYFTVAQAFNTTMVVGVFRAGGDTKFGLIMDVSTMWGFSILLGAVAAFILHASVPVVYVILMSDELIKVPITLKRYLTYKWMRDVTREQKELEEM